MPLLDRGGLDESSVVLLLEKVFGLGCDLSDVFFECALRELGR